MTMHYDNRYTAQYMEQQANLEVAELKYQVQKLEKEKEKLQNDLEKLQKHLEILSKHGLMPRSHQNGRNAIKKMTMHKSS